MEGWKEVLRVPSTTPIGSLEFDNQSNLLWTSDLNGYITSYAASSNNYNGHFSMFPYTRFRSSVTGPVTQVLCSSNKIYSLSNHNINVGNKRGIPITNLNCKIDENYDNFSCMALNELNNELIISSRTGGLYKSSLNDRKSIISLNYTDDLAYIKHQSKLLTLGKQTGGVDLFDQGSNKVVKEFGGHSSGLSDLDINGNYLVTSGYSLRHNSYFVDPLVNLYDLRMMKLLAPISFPYGPSFVKFHPKLPNIILIGSKNGNLQMLDIFDQTKFQLYQLDLMDNANYIQNLKFSENGEFLAMSDSYNNVILWNFNDSKKFVNFPSEIEGITAMDDPVTPFGMDSPVPLNSIGMPYYKDPLLSNFGSNLIFTKETSKLPLKYDENIPMMQFMENKFDSTFNKYISLNKTKNSDGVPFLSESSTKFNDSNFTRAPNCYNKLFIKYSKFGIEDFNFDLFNKTSYSGLENNLDNSYLNSIFQLYKYSGEFQNVILQNLNDEWLPNDEKTVLQEGNFKGSSILNELGYLFDMLNKAKGKNCRIINFSEFFNSIAPRELVNFDDLKSVNSQDLKTKILNFNGFFLGTLMDDFHHQNSLLKEFTQVIGLKYVTGNQMMGSSCLNINSGTIVNSNIVDSLNRTVRNIITLPKVLSINVNLNNRDFKLLNKNWVSEYIHTESVSKFYSFCQKPKNYKSYKLLGYVAQVSNGPEPSVGNHNLVSFVCIDNTWYLFNDFLVKKIDKTEVLDFQKDNKKPLVLLYEITDHEPLKSITRDDFDQINDDILYRDHFALTIRNDYIKQYKLLTRTNPPKPGSLIAIDAEFVMLEEEKFELSSKGVKNLIQPTKLSLARISVIDDQETPFIDDYVIHTQPIKDYLTSFSGILPGDLDPLKSTKNLVTFQTCYRRLWLLLNLGCVFIGHGLQNDFRTINIHVPQSQIRDTSQLYFLADYRRKLSLKFLSYVVLQQNVQVGNHDSIEDARYALKLFKRYEELETMGVLEDSLDDIYYEGLKMNFRVPET